MSALIRFRTDAEVVEFSNRSEYGLRRDGSKYAIDEFVEVKYVCFGGIDGRVGYPRRIRND